MQAALRRPRPDSVWTDFCLFINNVIHKKHEQLCLYALGVNAVSIADCTDHRVIKVEMRELLCS